MEERERGSVVIVCHMVVLTGGEFGSGVEVSSVDVEEERC